MKMAFKKIWSQTLSDKCVCIQNINSTFLGFNLSKFSYWLTLCNLHACFMTSHITRKKDPTVFPIAMILRMPYRSYRSVQLPVHWLGLLAINTCSDFSLQGDLKLNSTRAQTNKDRFSCQLNHNSGPYPHPEFVANAITPTARLFCTEGYIKSHRHVLLLAKTTQLLQLSWYSKLIKPW